MCVCSTHAQFGDFWKNTPFPLYDTILHTSPKQLEACSAEKSLMPRTAVLKEVLLMYEKVHSHCSVPETTVSHSMVPEEGLSGEVVCSKTRIQTQNMLS